MANNKKFVVKNGLQTQNIDFVANNESNTTSIIIDDAGLLSVEGNLKISGALYDSNNQTGNVGEILVSSSDGTSWQTVSGISGLSGESGFSGFSGYSGFSGVSGYSGTSGYSGYSGTSGFSGISGFSGESGFSGFSGISGQSGLSGFSGYSGETGEQGESGISGYSGTSGYSGYSGFSGASAPAIIFDGGDPFNDYTAGPVFDAGGIE
jgi:hypothetical protein